MNRTRLCVAPGVNPRHLDGLAGQEQRLDINHYKNQSTPDGHVLAEIESKAVE